MATSYPTKSSSKAIPRGAVWAFLGLFAVTVTFLGGSSRPDIVQIGPLRPLAALFLIPALYLVSSASLQGLKAPMLLLSGLMAWMIIQLVPLPPSLWQGLADRDVVAELDRLVAGKDLWRPISMVPARGINALVSLVVPLAAFALVVALRVRLRDVFVVVAAIGMLDAALCFLQLLTGANGPLYLYSVTNRGFAVGIFANENHSAVFSSLVLLICARLFADNTMHRDAPWLRVFSAVTFGFALLALLISGSRAGIVTGLFAAACSVVMLYQYASTRQSNAQTKRGRQRPSSKQSGEGQWAKIKSGLLGNPRKLATIGFVVLVAIVALFVLNGRAAGLESALNESALDGLRIGLLPILQQMIGTHWLFGTGFGSFQEVYHIYEPTDLLSPKYVNQAHNDWAQIIIEGGLPAVFLLVMLFAWIASCLRSIWSSSEEGRAIVLFWVAAFGILMAASVPDYPLRTPIFQMVAVWLIVCLAIESNKPQLRTRPR